MPVPEVFKKTLNSKAIPAHLNESCQPKRHLYEMTMRLAQKRGALAKVARLVSERGIAIEALNFSSDKGGAAFLYLTLRGERGQVQGLINDARRLSEIKDIQLGSN